jgi:cytoskeletal protein CcmA (bactofilin family)
MNQPSVVGSSIVIKGEITAQEDLVISGRVEGTITAGAFVVTVKEGAQVVADITARAIEVSGKVLGHLSAQERIELEQTADVEGELSAPALLLQYGATFKGKAETTGGKKPALSKAS